VNQRPSADAGPDKSSIVGESIEFDGSRSSDSDGEIIGFQWNFGDGAGAGSAITRHMYVNPGIFTATLTVTDNIAATGTDTAAVTVQTIPEAIQALSDLVRSLNLVQGISNSLDAKLQAILAALEAAKAGKRQDAVSKLGAFIQEVEAQRGKQLTNSQAEMLLALARRIVTVI
jgi:hypothetical protein